MKKNMTQVKKFNGQVKLKKNPQPLQMRIALAIKMDGIDTASRLARFLSVSYEAVRKELILMSKFDLIHPKDGVPAGGRPSRTWALTVKGEHLFPKDYDAILDETLFVLTSQKSKKVLIKLLQQLASNKADKISKKSQSEGLAAALAGLYRDSDEFIEIKTTNNSVVIVEKNCPILKTALAYPAICSTTTNALSKTFGQQVVRVEKFQSGHSRCVFKVTDKPYRNTFVFESDQFIPSTNIH